MSELRERFRRWRLLRAELRLRDAEHDLAKWGFGLTPSERHRAEKRIERLEERLERLAASVVSGEGQTAQGCDE